VSHADPVALYRVRRDAEGRVSCAIVHRSGFESPLPHLCFHSPDGFEIGYAGSGPSDLARSIIGHYLDEKKPNPDIYHEFKRGFLTDPALRDGVDISVGAITKWLETTVRVW
jgi:hypothetical protein